jgi:hypothetical protein
MQETIGASDRLGAGGVAVVVIVGDIVMPGPRLQHPRVDRPESSGFACWRGPDGTGASTRGEASGGDQRLELNAGRPAGRKAGGGPAGAGVAGAS